MGLSWAIARVRKGVIFADPKDAGHSGTSGRGGDAGETADKGREKAKADFFCCCSATKKSYYLFCWVTHSCALLARRLGRGTASF